MVWYRFLNGTSIKLLSLISIFVGVSGEPENEAINFYGNAIMGVSSESESVNLRVA